MPIKKRPAPRPQTADDGQVRGRFSRTRLWLVDMDDTIFNASAGMLDAIHRRMESFIAQKLGISIEEAQRVQKDYWRRYGATFVGLERHHGIDPQEFFDAAHDFDLRPYLKTPTGKERLRAILRAMPGKKVVLTNGPGKYAHEVLRLLRLEGVFEDVVSANDMKLCGLWRSKPDALLFANMASRFGASLRQTAFIDDNPNNLLPAKALGMMTVWCRGLRNALPASTAHPWADLVVENLDELARKLPKRSAQ